MRSSPNQNSRIASRTHLPQIVGKVRAEGRSIVLTNGCFDVIHVGHVRYLEGAARLGDVLIVGVNSDDRVRQLKGNGRPFQDQDDRAEVISSIRCVDLVTIFHEPTVEELIAIIRPDVHAKGTDYTEGSVPEREFVLAYGGRIAIVGDPKDHSSTELISAIGEFQQR